VTPFPWIDLASVSLPTQYFFSLASRLFALLPREGRTIRSPYSADPQKTIKLATELHAHPLQYAHNLVSIKQEALEKPLPWHPHQDGQEWGTASRLSDPHWLPLTKFLWWTRFRVRRRSAWCSGYWWPYLPFIDCQWCREIFYCLFGFSDSTWHWLFCSASAMLQVVWSHVMTATWRINYISCLRRAYLVGISLGEI